MGGVYRIQSFFGFLYIFLYLQGPLADRASPLILVTSHEQSHTTLTQPFPHWQVALFARDLVLDLDYDRKKSNIGLKDKDNRIIVNRQF